MNKVDVLRVLSEIKLDGKKENLIHPNTLQSINIKGDNLDLELGVSNPSLHFKNRLKSDIESKVLDVFPNAIISLNFIYNDSKIKAPNYTIRNIVAVASGKGGVGKSTISSNLAVSLKNQGYKVGLIDADIYGPSIPLMFDAENIKPRVLKKHNRSFMEPVKSYGVNIMSIGFFASPGQAVVWRGPMATKALKEMINQTYWGDLDYLLIDLPPGTGDIHLSIVQSLSLTGAIIVTTPQPVSLVDAKKAINMFQKKDINVPVIGVIENMSWLLVQDKKHYIFGKDGGKRLSDSESVELLAEIPLQQTIREAGDVGRPAALQETETGILFNRLSKTVDKYVVMRNTQQEPTKKVEITHNRGCN